MRKLLLILAVGFVLLTSCVMNRIAENRRDVDAIIQQLEEKKLAEQAQREETKLALQTKLETYRGVIWEGIKKAEDAGSPVFIYDYSKIGPDSAGGVGCRFNYINISDKRLKYVNFNVAPYNAVDDMVSCTIRKRSAVTLEHTGYIAPFAYNDRFISSYAGFGNIWYNYDIQYIKINRIEVIFEDGSKISLIENNIDHAVLNSDITADSQFRWIFDDGR